MPVVWIYLLAAVLLAIGILASLAGPGYQHFLMRNRAVEARTVLEAIAHAQLAYYRDHGEFVACAPSPEEVPRGVRGRFRSGATGWRQLGMSIDGPVWYQYAVTLQGDSFEAVAIGDLDADGRHSRLVLDGTSFEITVTDELE